MEKLLGQLYREDYQAMSVELTHMNIQPQKANERLKQLQQYRHLEMCVGGAKAILEFARKYGLKGDFEDIKTIASVSSFLCCKPYSGLHIQSINHFAC